MEDVISTSVSSFIKFLSEKETALKHHKFGSILISFAVQLKDFSIIPKLDYAVKYFSKLFYFEQPEKGFSFTGINECIRITENGIGRFAANEKKSHEWNEKFINNWEIIPDKRIPLFIGGMKFSAEHPDEVWSDFNDSTWFIPEMLFLKNSSGEFFIYNFLYSRGSDKQALSEKYRDSLESIIKPSVHENNKVLKKELSGSSPKDKKKWKLLIKDTLESILDKKVDKVVYSRRVDFSLSGEPDYNEIISGLRNNYPTCFIFIFRQDKSIFFGATPEKLAKFSHGKIEIDALAGSATRGNSTQEDDQIANSLLKDEKNLSEHNIVTEHIKSALVNFTSDIEIEKPEVIRLANIQHIRTKIKGTRTGKMFPLLNELFPTPAVCGLPKKTALELIKKNEGYHRGMYSGMIGWFNLEDEAEFAVAIRSALIKGNKLYAFAGSGIVADSDPEEEYKETELKLQPILSLFKNEN